MTVFVTTVKLTRWAHHVILHSIPFHVGLFLAVRYFHSVFIVKRFLTLKSRSEIMKATLGFSLLVKAVMKLIGKTLKVYVIVFSIMT